MKNLIKNWCIRCLSKKTRVITYSKGGFTFKRVKCSGCSYNGPITNDKEDAIKQWNKENVIRLPKGFFEKGVKKFWKGNKK